MQLPNKYFEDFPIEFKQINPEDFSKIFKTEKTTVELEAMSYLNDVVQKEMKIQRKNTVVINTPVGNGKSYAIIQTIKRFYEAKEEYLIFVASPFVSLVDQYYKSIQEFAGIPESQIYNYNNIGRKSNPYIGKKVQVVTANTLLGNPGEDGYKNSDAKRMYLKNLQEHCESNNIKVVFIYDEIHDTIHNFKEEFIFNLWNWKNVIHKNFIISATFSEASKVVVEYLAELTDRKIQIIESERKRNPKNESKLFLHYSSVHNFTNETPEIKDTILDILKRGKNIDILSYSKVLAKSIITDKTLGGKLKEKFGEINDCTSENIDNERPENEPPENRFDNDKCNVGTNFKSGVSIQKENHAFVIILPPRATRSTFKNKYGIFSSGITSIVQAIARKRKKGEIHIILPRPDEFDYEPLKYIFTEEQQYYFKYWYQQIKHSNNKLKDKDKVRYIPLKFQSWFLSDFYEETLKKNVSKGIEYSQASDRLDLARLDFPPYKNFVLARGEDYLAQTFKIWGADLSAYLTYSAFTNQFVNCNLAQINYKNYLFFKEDEIQIGLRKYFDIYFGEDYEDGLFSFSNFNLAYNNFRNRLFEEFTLKFQKKDKEDWETINPFNNSKFERQVLRFVAHTYYGKNYHNQNDYEAITEDREYSRAEYFVDGISCARGLNLEEISYNEEEKERVLAFQNLNYFRQKLDQNITPHSIGEDSFSFLPVKPFRDFISNDELPKFTQLTEYFRKNDLLIKNGVFEFMRKFDTLSLEKKFNSFYRIILEDFFVMEQRAILPKINFEGNRRLVKPIQSVKELPARSKTINLIEPQEYTAFVSEDYIKSFAEENYGSLENYYKMISDALKE
ncbi:DEAD/DEAH box helicase family protein [Chryseobacterium sp.]|uniref:DEAD/DEAH box helicase family protein n=1 Tax=Chryseobacterium sp. TaxID=1871047 RepID=UPI0035C76416